MYIMTKNVNKATMNSHGGANNDSDDDEDDFYDRFMTQNSVAN